MSSKTLVLFVFHIYNERVSHFVNNSIFYNPNIDFIIVSNNLNTSIHRSTLANVKYMFRENKGYDFGGWSDALLTDNLYTNYDYFIFVNSSVIGPFIPSYVKLRWTDIYIQGLTGDVKLFGSTINTIEDPANKAHVQSYIFSLDKEALQYLIDCEIFSKTNMAATFIDAVNNKEVLMSRKIIERGWNIGSLLPCYKGIDFRSTIYNIPKLNDLMYVFYRNKYWNEYDLVFIKGNRIPITGYKIIGS